MSTNQAQKKMLETTKQKEEQQNLQPMEVNYTHDNIESNFSAGKQNEAQTHTHTHTCKQIKS